MEPSLQLQPGDIVASRKPITIGRNGNTILADTVGIVVDEHSKRKIGVQFELEGNKITPTILCFPSNLREL